MLLWLKVVFLSFGAALSGARTRVAAWQGSCQTLGLWRHVMARVSYYQTRVNDRAMVRSIVLSNYCWDFNLGSTEALSGGWHGAPSLLLTVGGS